MTPHTYEELKRIENVREDEIGMIAEPFFAKGYLTGRRGCPWHIIGMEKAMQQCIPPSRAHEWDAYKHGWERLLKMVEEGDLVLLFVRDRPPMIPAFCNVNGQWEVDFMWYPAAQWRFEHFLRDLRLRQQEQERRAQQATPRRREELPLDWVTLERPTLGPHDTGDDPPVMVAGLGGALKGILQGAKKANKTDKPENSATPPSRITAEEAAARYPKQHQQYLTRSNEQLKKAADSHTKQIEQHQEWVSNPRSKISHWDTLSKKHQQNVLHHWNEDIKRHEAYREIAKQILQERGVQ